MKKISMLFAMMCMMMLVGCDFQSINFSSMNVQRAGLRNAADISATLALDNVSSTNIDAVLNDTKAVASAASKFLDSGSVGALTTGQIRIELIKVVPIDYQLWVDLALNYVSQYNLDPGVVGNKTISHLKAFFYGITVATDRYSKGDRELTNTKEISTLKTDKVKYNQALRKRMK